MSQILELKDSRAKVLEQAKAMMNKAKEEGRDLSAEESHKVDDLYAEFDKIGERLNTLEKQNKLEAAESELRHAVRKVAPLARHTEGKAHVGSAIRTWFLTGGDNYRPTLDEKDNAERCGISLSSNRATVRAMSKTGNADLVAWREFWDGYVEYLKYYGYVTQLVTVLDTDTGVTMPLPVFDDNANSGRWLAEATAFTSTDPTTSGLTLGAHKATSDEISVSMEMLQDSQTALEQLLPMMLGTRIGRLVNAAVTNGDGSGKPRGLLLDATASSFVSGGTGASPTVTIDNLLDLKYSVDPAYRNAPSGKKGFMFNDRYLAQIRKSKDAQNRYFADPFASGPGTLDGEPIHINNDVPATGVNAKIAAYGDFSKYLLRSVKEVEFKRLDEIRARENMVVFLAFARYDGRLLVPNAVKTLAAPAS